MTPAALKRLRCHLGLPSPEPMAEHACSEANVPADKLPVVSIRRTVYGQPHWATVSATRASHSQILSVRCTMYHLVSRTFSHGRVQLGPITLLMAAFNCAYIRIFRSA